MRSFKQANTVGRLALVAGALVLTGCVSDAYVYDDLPAVRQGSGSAPYPPSYYYGDPYYAGYYGYPGRYGHPGYYGYSPYPPRVVYHDHDHRDDDCHHPSHHDGRPHEDRDHQDRDHQDRDPRDGRPRDRDGHAEPRPPAEPRSEPAPRGMRVLRPPQAADPDDRPGTRREPD